MQGRDPAPPAVAVLTACPRPWLIGVLHLPPLPGAPGSTLSVDRIAEDAARDALLLQECGFTAVMIENFHDSPFFKHRVEPETVAAMALVARGVRRHVDIPLGVNVLRNDAPAALAVAATAGASFLRVNVLAGTVVTDQGTIEGEAAMLLRRRASLGAAVSILADVDVKHATSLDTRPVTVRARDLVTRSGADAVLVTGQATGSPVDLPTLSAVAESVAPTPVLAASGTTPDTLPAILEVAAGAVVGTALQDPDTGRLDERRVRDYAGAAS